MGLSTGVGWTDATWNPWLGCTKVSPACKNCYMFAGMKMYGKDPTTVRRSSDNTFKMPLKRNREKAYKLAPGSKCFTCSWSDWFHAAADEWRDDAWAVIRQRPDVLFQIVTKRTERITACLPADWGGGYRNVILIATVEDQERADKRIAELRDIPAYMRGLSIEPMLGPIDLSIDGLWCSECPYCIEAPIDWTTGVVECRQCEDSGRSSSSAFDWCIFGGESGVGATRRELDIDAMRATIRQCVEAGVPVYVKQDSALRDGQQGRIPDDLWSLKQFPEWHPHPAVTA